MYRKKALFMITVIFTILLIPSISALAASAPVLSNCTIEHRHTGSSASGGGCYGNPNICGGAMETHTENPHGCGISASGGGCPHCGCWYEAPSAQYPSGCAHCNCPKPSVTRCRNCGREGGGGSCSAVLSYSLTCSKTTLAKLSLTPSTTEWTKSLDIQANIENLGLSLTTTPYSWNGSAGTDVSTFSVADNGTYTCKLIPTIFTDNNASDVAATIQLQNLDNKAPTITEIIWDETLDIVNTTITVTAEDLQEDGTKGVDMHVAAYSFDGGITWGAESNKLVTQNGDYTVCVRDALENMATQTISIVNIDMTAPIVNAMTIDPASWTNGKVTIYADASDSGSGIESYSWDDGNTWVKDNSLVVDKNGTYKVIVKDTCGNIASGQTDVPNIDITPPTISWSLNPGEKEWFQDSATLYINATDNLSGIYLYSFDSGGTWIKESSLKVNDSTEISLNVRDCAGNISSATISLRKQVLPLLPPIEPPKKADVKKTLDIIRKEAVKVPTKEILPLPKIKNEKTTVSLPVVNSPVRKVSVLPMVAGTAAGTSFLTFCFMYFFPLIPIYGKKLDGTYKFIGAAVAKRKNKNYYLQLKNLYTEKAETNSFKIRLGTFFALANKNKNFIIRLNNEDILRKVDRELFC